MIVRLNNQTYRIQFIKQVENRKHGKTTIMTICRVLKHVGEENFGDGSGVRQLWEEVSRGASRQNPVDKYSHLIGKRVALSDAMIKKLTPQIVDELCMNELLDVAHLPDALYYFDRVERSIFAQALEAEFVQST